MSRSDRVLSNNPGIVGDIVRTLTLESDAVCRGGVLSKNVRDDLLLGNGLRRAGSSKAACCSVGGP